MAAPKIPHRAKKMMGLFSFQDYKNFPTFKRAFVLISTPHYFEGILTKNLSNKNKI